MTRRRDKRIIPLCSGIFVAIFAFIFLINRNDVENADAADLSKFDPGNIISDYTMSNYNSMTEAEIQKFLTEKNPCNNRDKKSYESLTAQYPNITWHWKDNHFVCVSEELFGDGMVIGEGKTAAKIIYETAQKYKINPQVLIVLIEKESGVITDSFPNSLNYRTMTGFGCPDTAPCDSKYFGFKNQLEKAAALFREVLDGGWTNYPLGENYIQYNPDRNCGGSIVNIKNLATSSLYRYTPYQPNAATLSAGRGTAYCGAYGNRNFYSYFYDWFGDPTDTEYTTVSIGINNTYSTKKEVLGEKTGKIEKNPATGIYYQQFKNGLIVGNNEKGYYVSMGKIREVWQKNGFESGKLGFPIGNIECNSSTKLCWQTYEKGVVVGNDEKGYFISAGKIREAWKKNGFESGELGFPTSEIECDKDKQNCKQTYEKGIIAGNDKEGYFASVGKIYEAWKKDNYEKGTLGKMTGEKGCNDSTKLCWQTFEKGLIVGNDEKGYFISMGKIRDVWKKYGFESGELGFPKGNIECDKDRKNCKQVYEKGVIAGNDKDGYFIAIGKIYEAWKKDNYETGTLGKITGEKKCNNSTKLCWQTYEKGLIVGNDEKGYFISMGKIREVWSNHGFESGELGFPTGNKVCNNSTKLCWQTYEKGLIVGNDEKGYFISMGKIRETWKKYGFESGELGFPTGNIDCNNNTKLCWQAYEKGLIVGNDEKGYFISMGKIRDVWSKNGFEGGLLGFPQGDIVTEVNNIKSQKYEKGTIYEDGRVVLKK